MKTISVVIAALSMVVAAACNNNATSNPQASGPAVAAAQRLSPEQLGALGAKIRKHPADAQKILSGEGLTERSFEQAVRKIAESPDDSKRYAAAYKKAS